MTHLETELQHLKDSTLEMMRLVKLQIEKSRDAVFNFDKNMAREVIFYEKRVNSLELKIDRDCENCFLLNPLAVDLRFVISVLKINSHLERMADNAEGICRFISELDKPFNETLIENIRLKKMYGFADEMISNLILAFEKEDAQLARNVLQQDEEMDKINIAASRMVATYIKERNDDIIASLNAHNFVRKLERVGDLSKNIAEEIIFYLEAKVLKHKN